MVFTGIDKALLQRTARELEAQATKLEKSVGGVWAGQRKAKQAFDALHRDARDLRALVKRLTVKGPANPALLTLLKRIHALRLGAPDSARLGTPDSLPGAPDFLVELSELADKVAVEGAG